jgi:hypothetical protein
MNQDKELRDLLHHALPEEQVSEDFTERTVRRLSKGPAGHGRWRTAYAIAGALLVLVIAIPLLRHLNHASQQANARAELEQLKEEHDRLAAKLAELRDETEEQPQLLYLGGTDNANYVVDLRRLALKAPAKGAPQATF